MDILQMTISILFIIISTLLIYYAIKARQAQKKETDNRRLELKAESLNRDIASKEKLINQFNQSIEDLHFKRICEVNAYQEKLEKEYQELLAASPLPTLQLEIEEYERSLITIREITNLHQAQISQKWESENYILAHSIQIPEDEKSDIDSILSFAKTLKRPEAFRKIVWSEFIQKPIQNLCKQLGVERVSGVYIIRNIENERMYIGEAKDIASRWKEHCKSGLGIGGANILTNRFYRALYKEGIDKFTFDVLEKCPPEKLLERELYWIDFYNAATFGYNSKIGG